METKQEIRDRLMFRYITSNDEVGFQRYTIVVCIIVAIVFKIAGKTETLEWYYVPFVGMAIGYIVAFLVTRLLIGNSKPNIYLRTECDSIDEKIKENDKEISRLADQIHNTPQEYTVEELGLSTTIKELEYQNLKLKTKKELISGKEEKQ